MEPLRHRAMVLMAFVAMVIAAFGTGIGVAHAMQRPTPPSPTLLTGADWSTFGFREKELYLSGFIAGAAAEQVRGRAMATGSTADSITASSDAIGMLRAAKQLHFSYAPSVYASQIDDYYWWVDHVSTPIVDVMITVNRRMKGE